jgi:hypothetical protein
MLPLLYIITVTCLHIALFIQRDRFYSLMLDSEIQRCYMRKINYSLRNTDFDLDAALQYCNEFGGFEMYTENTKKHAYN